MSSLARALVLAVVLAAPLPAQGQPVAARARGDGDSRALPSDSALDHAAIRPLIEDGARAPITPRVAIAHRRPPAARPSPDSALAARLTRPHASRLPAVFYGALAVGATVTVLIHFDPDSGGYRDGWTTVTDFPDKAVHALAAWAITTVGVDLGARPRTAAIAVCAAGAAYELAQGYASPYDVAADCVGAAGAALWQSWRARRKARRPAVAAAP